MSCETEQQAVDQLQEDKDLTQAIIDSLNDQIALFESALQSICDDLDEAQAELEQCLNSSSGGGSGGSSSGSGLRATTDETESVVALIKRGRVAALELVPEIAKLLSSCVSRENSQRHKP